MMEWFAENPVLSGIIKAVVLFAVPMQIVPGLIYFERRICAWIQDRKGPNRVGPIGALQPLADVVKLLMKEDIAPKGVDRAIYVLAPALVFIPSMLAFAIVPVGMDLQVFNPNSGVIFAITIGSFAVYGLSFGGWASNNKYSLLGGLRSSAQMISYEAALFLALMSALMMAGTVDLNVVVRDQIAHGWNIWRQPVGAVLFLVASFAETNRLPFDLAECESELIGGYHTEYTSMKFAMFFLGEYIAMITMSALMVTLFLGGWSMPTFLLTIVHDWFGVAISFDQVTLGTMFWSIVFFSAKTSALLFLFIWVRWTLPRFRYDQLMRLGWKVMIPVALANLAITATVIVLMED